LKSAVGTFDSTSCLRSLILNESELLTANRVLSMHINPIPQHRNKKGMRIIM
jgi:hypothetical protein